MTNKCGLCMHFDEYDAAPDIEETWADDDTIGKCKRFPPVLLVQKLTYAVSDWGMPSVRSSDWCGEFVALQERRDG
jgi:hypothetical protein